MIRLPAARRQSLPEWGAKVLKRYILIERLEPGDRLPPERRLADALHVSRTALREALSQLVGEGIVTRNASRVLCVADFDRMRVAAEVGTTDDPDPEMREHVELRVILEIGAIEAIVDRATPEHLREIERWVVEGERRVAAGEPIMLADARFHAALLHVLGNSTIDGLLPIVEEHFRSALTDLHRLMESGSPDDFRVMHEHRQIYEAIKRRDANTARLVMLSHLHGYLKPDRTRGMPEPANWTAVEEGVKA